MLGHEFPRGALSVVLFTDRAAVPAHVLVRILDRESVLLNLETEQYFGLDETGTRMWRLETASPNIDAAFQELLAEYDVEPELLGSNLIELLDRLVNSGLLQVFPADVGTVPAI
jgi:Coenzyme PQQ synthesis protein D (PqqD)